MSNSLDQLARLQSWRLDEARRKVIELERLAEHLRAEMASLDAELARERAAADRSAELRQAFAGYASLVRDRRSKLEKSLRGVETETEQAREEVAEAFRDLKKYEEASRNRAAVRRVALRRREQAVSDEIGLSMYRRRR